MENVLLTIHLILALLLIGVVLLQRSEGGGLGIGGGGGTMSARGAATAMTKLTWIFAAAFIVTSISLTIIAARGRDGGSVVDTAATAPATDTGTTAPAPDAPATTGGGLAGTDLTLPGAKTDAPASPPPADAPAAPPANPCSYNGLPFLRRCPHDLADRALLTCAVVAIPRLPWCRDSTCPESRF